MTRTQTIWTGALLCGLAMPAAAAPDEFETVIAVDVVRNAATAPLAIVPWDGVRGTFPVAGAQAALLGFASDGDGVAFGEHLGTLTEAQRLLGLAALGHAMQARYDWDPGQGDVPVAGSWNAAAAWLSGVDGTDAPVAGRCGAIADALRTVATHAGFTDAVTLSVGDQRDAWHVVMATPLERGWAVVDYGTLAIAEVADLGALVELASAWRGRVMGEACVWDDVFVTRQATRAGAALRAMMDTAEDWFASPLATAPRATHGVAADATPDAQWGTGQWTPGWLTLSAFGGLIAAPASLGGRRSPAAGTSVEAHHAGPDWTASVRLNLATVGWRVPDHAQATTIAGLRAQLGRRMHLGAHHLGASVWFDSLGDVASMMRGLTGHRSDAFVEQLRPGATVAWSFTPGTWSCGLTAWTSAIVAPSDPRTEDRALYTDRSGIEATWNTQALSVSSSWRSDRLGWQLRGDVEVRGGPIACSTWVEHVASAREALQPSAQRVGGEVSLGAADAGWHVRLGTEWCTTTPRSLDTRLTVSFRW